MSLAEIKAIFTLRFTILVTGLMATTLALCLGLSVQSIQLSYESKQATEDMETMRQQRDWLKAQVEKESNPTELARKARELGMFPLKSVARLVVKEDGSTEIFGVSELNMEPLPEIAGGGSISGNGQSTSPNIVAHPGPAREGELVPINPPPPVAPAPAPNLPPLPEQEPINEQPHPLPPIGSPPA